MQLVWQTSGGTTALGDINWAKVRWGRELTRNDAGIGLGFLYTVTCSEIGFQSTSQAASVGLMNKITNALANPFENGNLLFLNDDGSKSANCILVGNTLGGVRCVQGPVWSDEPGALYINYQKYAAVFQYETAFASAPFLKSYHEIISVEGGGPVTIAVEARNNFTPVLQTITPFAKYVVMQSGEAVGYLRPPTQNVPLPFPIPPSRPRVSNQSASRVGSNYREFPTAWAYRWELSTLPFLPLPQQWVG